MPALSLRHWIRYALLLAALMHLSAYAAAAPAAGRRLALVIGNASYQSHPLKNTVNEARRIARRLG